jgi:hypothetical protein
MLDTEWLITNQVFGHCSRPDDQEGDLGDYQAKRQLLDTLGMSTTLDRTFRTPKTVQEAGHMLADPPYTVNSRIALKEEGTWPELDPVSVRSGVLRQFTLTSSWRCRRFRRWFWGCAPTTRGGGRAYRRPHSRVWAGVAAPCHGWLSVRRQHNHRTGRERRAPGSASIKALRFAHSVYAPSVMPPVSPAARAAWQGWLSARADRCRAAPSPLPRRQERR